MMEGDDSPGSDRKEGIHGVTRSHMTQLRKRSSRKVSDCNEEGGDDDGDFLVCSGDPVTSRLDNDTVIILMTMMIMMRVKVMKMMVHKMMFVLMLTMVIIIVTVPWDWGHVTRVSLRSGVPVGRLTHVHHLLETLGADTVQTAQQFGFPTAGVVAVVANLAFELFQCVDQRLSP